MTDSAPRILVVDDEKFNLEIITEFLVDTGYDLTLADSGEAAWDLLVSAEAPFDLILLDRMMPGMDGIELLRRIKGEVRHSAVPVIMQTAAAAPEQVRQGLDAGAYYYLTKPFEPESLLAIVRAALESMTERRGLAQRASGQIDVLRLASRGEFSVRTLQEAQDVAALCAQLCPDPEVAGIGLSELMVNAIEHGNLGVLYEEKSRLKREDIWAREIERRLALPENGHKRVTLTFHRDITEMIFTIRDCGPGFDWTRYLDLDPERAFDPNGRGIALARHISFDRLEYHGSGSEVEAAVGLAPD
jgi:CheY-like chemotaxis protein/anti-sigma regulatory factor (Ser/Thr protein kinase)